MSRGNSQRMFRKVLRFLFFRTLSKVFGISPNIFLQDCQSCFLCVQRTFMGQRVFQIKKLFYFPSLLNFEQKLFVFSSKNSDNIVKIAFHMSRKSFWGFFFRNICAFSFFGVWLKTVWTFVGKLLTSSLNGTLSVQINNLRKMVIRTFCFLFFSFSDSIEKALDGLAIIPIGLWKLHFTCPSEHFEGKMPFLKQKAKHFEDFFLESLCLFFFVVFGEKLFELSSENLWQVL